MKLVTLYIPKEKTESFHQWLCDKRNVNGEIKNLTNNPNDFLYIESFSNWIDELDKEDIYEIKSLVGDFSSFTIHWRNNHNLFMFLSEINEIYSFISKYKNTNIIKDYFSISHIDEMDNRLNTEIRKISEI